MAVARLKRVLHDPVRRIEVTDMVHGEADKIVTHVADQARFPIYIPQNVPPAYDVALTSMRTESDTLLHLLATAVFHDDGTHNRVWLGVIQRLMAARGRIDGTFNDSLDAYRSLPRAPRHLGRRDRGDRVPARALPGRSLTEPTWRPQFNDRNPRPAADVLRPMWLLEASWLNQLPRWGEPTRWLYSASHLLRLEGREPVRALLPDDNAYAAACDRLECLASYVAVDAARELVTPRSMDGRVHPGRPV